MRIITLQVRVYGFLLLSETPLQCSHRTITTLFVFLFLVSLTTLTQLAALPSWQTLGSLASQPGLTTIYFWSDLFPQSFLIYEVTVNTLGGIIYLPSMVWGDKESSLGKIPLGRLSLRNNKALSQCPLSGFLPLNESHGQELGATTLYTENSLAALEQFSIFLCCLWMLGTETRVGTGRSWGQIPWGRNI